MRHVTQPPVGEKEEVYRKDFSNPLVDGKKNNQGTMVSRHLLYTELLVPGQKLGVDIKCDAAAKGRLIGLQHL
jgi:hypothetical protein